MIFIFRIRICAIEKWVVVSCHLYKNITSLCIYFAFLILLFYIYCKNLHFIIALLHLLSDFTQRRELGEADFTVSSNSAELCVKDLLFVNVVSLSLRPLNCVQVAVVSTAPLNDGHAFVYALHFCCFTKFCPIFRGQKHCCNVMPIKKNTLIIPVAKNIRQSGIFGGSCQLWVMRTKTSVHHTIDRKIVVDLKCELIVSSKSLIDHVSLLKSGNAARRIKSWNEDLSTFLQRVREIDPQCIGNLEVHREVDLRKSLCQSPFNYLTSFRLPVMTCNCHNWKCWVYLWTEQSCKYLLVSEFS